MAMLGQLLKSNDGREKLVTSLIKVMKRRKRVNITTLGRKVAEQISEEAAVYAEQCLMAAAKETSIFLMDGKEIIRGVCFKRDDKWFIRRWDDDEEIPVCSGDFLTVFAADGSKFIHDVVNADTPTVDTDRPFTLGWEGELVKGDAEEE